MPHFKVPRFPRSALVRFGTAILLVLAAGLLRFYVAKQSPSLPFIFAITLSAWFGGLGPGILATVLASVSHWMLMPGHSPRTLVEITMGMGFFLVLSLPIKKIYDGYRKTADAVLALAKGLEDRDRKLSISEENLRSETTKLKAILNSMGEGVMVADRSGNVLVYNPAANEILGAAPEQGNVRDWPQHQTLYLPDTQTPYPVTELPLARALRGEPADDVEVFYRNERVRGGAWLNVTARPLLDERGESAGAVAVFRDISAGKRFEEAQIQAKKAAEQANQAKSEFLSRMSHELRTPLNSILGFAQLLELGELTESQSESVEHILKGGRHLLGLINEVLDIARIEAGRLSLSPEPVLVSDVVQQALELVRPIADQRGVVVNAAVVSRCERHVLADRQRLTQVLLNLLSNAVKYNHAGGAVSLLCDEQANGAYRIKVTDTGRGIPAESLEKLFTPFERLDADQSGVEGTGLGLAVCKRLVEAMGGAIGVESAAGQGSSFWVDFTPVAHPVEETQPRVGRSLYALSAGTAAAAYTVIYIEDNSSNLRLMDHILVNRPEIKLITATRGDLGLELVRAHRPDLVLLDLHLPDVHGDEILRRLRGDPRTKTIPVIMVSADATPRQIERIMGAGATDYLTKPLDVRKFLDLLDRTLAGKRETSGEWAASAVPSLSGRA